MQIWKRHTKTEKKIFVFAINAFELFCIELSVLIREYLSSAVNVLTKSLKTLHVTKSDFYQLNYFHCVL